MHDQRLPQPSWNGILGNGTYTGDGTFGIRDGIFPQRVKDELFRIIIIVIVGIVRDQALEEGDRIPRNGNPSTIIHGTEFIRGKCRELQHGWPRDTLMCDQDGSILYKFLWLLFLLFRSFPFLPYSVLRRILRFILRGRYHCLFSRCFLFCIVDEL